MRHLPITIAFTTIIATAANAQNVSAGAGSKESREAIGNTGTTPPAPPTDAAQPVANDAAPANAAEPRFKVSGGFMQQFNTGLNTGGNYAASRAYGAFSSRTRLTDNMNMDVGLAYEYDHYQFHDTNLGLGVNTLDTMTLSVTPRFTVALDSHWAVSGAPIVQTSGENDADGWQTITGGGIASFRYAFDEDHVLGVGVLAKGLLGSGVLVVPAPLVDWRISEDLYISNVRAPEANPFVGLEIVKRLDTQFSAAFGGAWQFRQARLNDSGSDANYIFQESNTAIYGRFEWRPANALRVDFVVGSALYSRVKTLDGGGTTVTSTGGNPSLLLGVFASFKF